MPQSNVSFDERHERRLPPPQDQAQQLITAIRCLEDVLKAFLRPASTSIVPIRDMEPRPETMQEAQTLSSTASLNFKVKRHKETEPLTKKKVDIRGYIKCWKCRDGHYPRRCPQLQNKCYFCGDPNHKVSECQKKQACTCYSCKQPGHFANKCPEKLRLHNKSSYQKDHPLNCGKKRKQIEMSALEPHKLKGEWLLEDATIESQQKLTVKEILLHHEEPLETRMGDGPFKEH